MYENSILTPDMTTIQITKMGSNLKWACRNGVNQKKNIQRNFQTFAKGKIRHIDAHIDGYRDEFQEKA